ncbi:hypothetical protein EPA93_25285 [Ktedonosporobacter rubrisoli]|uniref:Uncharacterized protein n=1 Tax=Ktedonosporobacter rubrisoli TaxID=2509675 RepID=A0A4P6JVW2_KTERU|nr:hypothetical protein [Ktedonosporobacter rubrisoli]QBD79116.1 hypothetical protein EPA93_25285 [Ktedonosporobacter rubrisoli]
MVGPEQSLLVVGSMLVISLWALIACIRNPVLPWYAKLIWAALIIVSCTIPLGAVAYGIYWLYLKGKTTSSGG